MPMSLLDTFQNETDERLIEILMTRYGWGPDYAKVFVACYRDITADRKGPAWPPFPAVV